MGAVSCAVACCAVLCCAVLCCAVLWHACCAPLVRISWRRLGCWANLQHSTFHYLFRLPLRCLNGPLARRPGLQLSVSGRLCRPCTAKWERKWRPPSRPVALVSRRPRQAAALRHWQLPAAPMSWTGRVSAWQKCWQSASLWRQLCSSGGSGQRGLHSRGMTKP